MNGIVSTAPASTDLHDAARAARDRSYAPYSGFSMGAAVRVSGDEIITGALVENVSLGLAMCAERIAMFTAVSMGQRPREVALVSKRTAKRLTWPCGACLQVALELGGPDVVIHAVDLDGVSDSRLLSELLPLGPAVQHRADDGDGSGSSR